MQPDPIHVDWSPEQFNALLVDAERRGYDRAVAVLQDGEQYREWLADNLALTPPDLRMRHAAYLIAHREATP